MGTEKQLTPCGMCNNAFVNPELRTDNDLSYVTLGKSMAKMRIMMRSGCGKSTQIIVERYDNESGWYLAGSYRPRFCPNCGRELVENRKEIENGR